ncbi:hypothetical protein [Roseobacter weihaiensis]|uniref:hypothetical protein n=1 Tax=Roseobacter weihaiensis TaxID=2763262 RepID=UPI001D0BD36F|nr:hypothetical protein [Roseobacter sp. H9]
MSIKLNDALWGRMRASVVEKNDHDLAAVFRERNTEEVDHLSDEQLRAAIREAREAAFSFGITDTKLRMRFIMLGVLRLPRFWQDPTIANMLSAGTGTPDIRFGDVCAMFAMSAERADKQSGVWWS